MEEFICGSLTCAFSYYLLNRNLNTIYKEQAAWAAQNKITKGAEQKMAVISMLEIRERTTKGAEMRLKRQEML